MSVDVVEVRAEALSPEISSPWDDLKTFLVRRLSTDNPFYVLSALLVFVGLKTSFGAQASPEQTWALMFGLAGYTLLLAGPACYLVRVGQVWDDVRTVLLLVVLMFLATSVTMDEALSRDPSLGLRCSIIGLIFAVTVSEAILRAIRLNLPACYRWPYYLALALFFLYPPALLPLLDQPKSEALEWALFGFSPAAGLVTLTLLPAARRGRDYLRDNGSPWCWPLYPWVLFGLLGVCAGARSFLLCYSMQHVEMDVTEQWIFGPYFLVPLGMAVAVLLLEIGLGSRSEGAIATALFAPAFLVVISMVGHLHQNIYQQFLWLFVERLGGTPLYLTLVAALIFYLYAAARGTKGALGYFNAALGALVVVGPLTFNLNGLVAPRFWPLLAIAVIQLGLGVSRRSSIRCLVGVSCLALAIVVLPEIPHRGAIVFHVGLAASMILGAAFDDATARRLRVSAAIGATAAALALQSGWAEGAPSWAIWTYPLIVAILMGVYGWRLNHIPSMAVVPVVMSGEAVMCFGRGYRWLQGHVMGLNFIVLGLVMLAIAQTISAAKAGLLPRKGKLDKQEAVEPWM